jgi:hypothetical protein
VELQRQVVSFHPLKDERESELARKPLRHYSLKNLYRVKEEWVYRLCVLPADSGDDVRIPFQMCLTLYGHLYSCHWALVLYSFEPIPVQADPSSLDLVTINCHHYSTLSQSPKRNSSPALLRQARMSAK